MCRIWYYHWKNLFLNIFPFFHRIFDFTFHWKIPFSLVNAFFRGQTLESINWLGEVFVACPQSALGGMRAERNRDGKWQLLLYRELITLQAKYIYYFPNETASLHIPSNLFRHLEQTSGNACRALLSDVGKWRIERTSPHPSASGNHANCRRVHAGASCSVNKKEIWKCSAAITEPLASFASSLFRIRTAAYFYLFYFGIISHSELKYTKLLRLWFM